MKWISAFVVASLASASAYSEGTNWSWEASTRFRNETHSNPAGATGGSLATFDHQFTEQRTLLDLKFNRGEAFKGSLGLIHVFNWGDDGAANGTTEFNGSTSDSGTDKGGRSGRPRCRMS